MGWWSDLWDTIFPHGGGNTRRNIKADNIKSNAKEEAKEKPKKESDK